MGFGGNFGKIGEMKQMYDKYKGLKKSLDNLVIRAKEGTCLNSKGEEVGAVVVELDGEMKLRNFSINDESLLDLNNKSKLENLIVTCFQKAQSKAQEVVAEKTKDILGVDPNNLGALGDMLGGLGK